MELLAVIGLYGYIVFTDIVGRKVDYKKPGRLIITGLLCAMSICLALGFTFPSPSNYIKQALFVLFPFLKGAML